MLIQYRRALLIENLREMSFVHGRDMSIAYRGDLSHDYHINNENIVYRMEMSIEILS